MYIEERHERIINTLQSTGRIDVKKLADTFHVSRETIRRDLNILSENGAAAAHPRGRSIKQAGIGAVFSL